MQNYTEVPGSKAVRDSRILLLDNDKTIASHFSGTRFPADNLFVGMECYRTDLKIKYRLESVSPDKWEPVIKAEEIAKIKALSAKNADTAATCTGNAATASACTGTARQADRLLVGGEYAAFHWQKQEGQPERILGSGDGAEFYAYQPQNFSVKSAAQLTTPRKINGVEFSGTKDITINAGLTADSAIDVTGSEEKDYKDNVRLGGSISGHYGSVSLGGSTLTRLEGIVAGSYALKDLLQNLVTMSHKHGAIGANGAANCHCNCDCNCDSDGT